MKKIFTLLVLCVLCVFCAIGFTACDNTDTNTNNPLPNNTIQPTNNTPSSENNNPSTTYYTVTFNSDGGTRIAPIQVEESKKCPTPDTPQKIGYTLDGWYVGNEQWSFIGYTVTEDITLTAKWSIDESYLDIFDWEKIDNKYTINGIKDKTVTYITIPDYITNIGNKAFENCNNLSYINIGEGITSIGSLAFYNCNKLRNLFYYGTASQWAQIEGLAEIIGYPRNLYIITENQIEIKSLNEIVLENITEIKPFAFAYCCTSLNDVTIKNGIKIIGEKSFEYCINLHNITIPNSVTTIGSAAFFQCLSLKNITIPNSVTRIENGAFARCPSLIQINFVGTKEQWDAIDKDNNRWADGSSITQIICTDGTIDL